MQGGPGQVVVDSDQVRVTPQQFGAGVTRIRVEVKPLASGGALWTTLKLLTAGETLEVPVVAQWIPPTVSIPPGALVVAPDGSGNLRSLEEAVQQARPGAVIYLKAGIHRLKHPLVIDKPLTLIGEGMETTRIVCDGEGAWWNSQEMGCSAPETWPLCTREPSGAMRSGQTRGKCSFTVACSQGASGMRRTSAAAMGYGCMVRLVEMSESVWLYGMQGWVSE